MGLFDIFTGDPLKKAAQQSRAYMDQTKTANTGLINTGQQTSLANIGQGFGDARNALTNSYQTGVGGINTGYGDASSALAGGVSNARDLYGQARTDLGNASAAYDPLAALGEKYGKSTSLYQDSLGVNGAEGAARASAAFTPSQNYSFTLDQNLDAINRRRNAGGMLDSGNADRDAQEYGQGLASKELGGWQDRLAGFINPELSAVSGAATGRAGVATSLANLGVNQAGMETAYGQNQAGLDTGRAAMLAELAKQNGTSLASNYQGEAGALAGINTGAANAQVANNLAIMNPYTNTYKQEGEASMTGSKNLWGMGMAAAQMMMGMPPTSLGSLGGGGSSGLGGNPNQAMTGFSPNGTYFNYGAG